MAMSEHSEWDCPEEGHVFCSDERHFCEMCGMDVEECEEDCGESE